MKKRLIKKKVNSTREAASLAGRSAETEGEPRGLSEESAANSLWQAGQSETHTDRPSHSPACPSPSWGSISAGRGWVPEQGVRRVGLGKGLLLAVQRWPEGKGVRNLATRNAPQRSLDGHSSESALLSDAQRVRSQPQPLSTLQRLPLQARGGAPPGASTPAPIHCTLLPSPQSEQVGPSQSRSYKKCLTRT